MSGFATIDGRRSPSAVESVNILMREHLNTEEKKRQAIAVNKIELVRLKSGLEELRGAVQAMAEEFDQRLNILERLVLPPPPPGRPGTPSGGKRRRRRKRTRKKRRKN